MSLERGASRRARAAVAVIIIISTLPLLASAAGGEHDAPILFLRSKATADVKIDLEWEMTNDSAVDRYDIYWQRDPFDGVPDRDPDGTTTGTVHTVEGLRRHQRYHFLVAAVDADGDPLAHGEDSNTPGRFQDVGDLKEVNFWTTMLFFGVITAVYLMALWKVPEWVKEERVKEGRGTGGDRDE
jgi:hypothetical protein